MDGIFAADLPEIVTHAVAEALPTSDPLDRPEFDAIDYINAKFPSEQAALEALEPFLSQVTGEIGALHFLPPQKRTCNGSGHGREGGVAKE